MPDEDDLYARFLPPFVALARARVATALAAVQQRDHGATTTTVRELHSLAGEAGLLGLHAVIPLARDSEQKAKRLHVSHADEDADALVAALRELNTVIEGIGETISSPGG
jgi:HPt (histidine-containing phosphotransfer) domain-containing protein